MVFDEAAAIPLYEALIKDHPDHALSLNNLAWSYLTIKDRSLRNPRRALELASRSVELEPSIDHFDTLAEAYFQSKRRQDARETLQRAILEVSFSSERVPYLRAQYLRFQSGAFDSDPPPVE